MQNIEFWFVLENIRSAFNVGSITRTADALGANWGVITVGYTAPLTYFRVEKTALGAEKTVKTFHFDTIQKALDFLKSQKVLIYSVELSKNAVDYLKVDYRNTSVAFIMGNEVDGVSQTALELSDKVIYVPMLGIKESLNVANCASIVGFEIRRQLV